MPIQYDIFGNEVEHKPKPTNKEKRNWENAFQTWSNKEVLDGSKSYGACGYGAMCNYCDDNTYGRPCVRALNKLCRENNIVIDYSIRNFEDIWEGEFNAE